MESDASVACCVLWDSREREIHVAYIPQWVTCLQVPVGSDSRAFQCLHIIPVLLFTKRLLGKRQGWGARMPDCYRHNPFTPRGVCLWVSPSRHEGEALGSGSDLVRIRAELSFLPPICWPGRGCEGGTLPKSGRGQPGVIRISLSPLQNGWRGDLINPCFLTQISNSLHFLPVTAGLK